MDGDDFYRFLVSGLFSLIIDIPPPPPRKIPRAGRNVGFETVELFTDAPEDQFVPHLQMLELTTWTPVWLYLGFWNIIKVKSMRRMEY